MNPAIYRITNLINGKSYVGQSRDVEKRWRQHKTNLRGGYHENNHLQRSWNKYGEDNFSFEIIKECEAEYLDELEIFYIAFYDSMNNGYNHESGGNANKTPSPETRRKLSEGLIGNEYRRKYFLWDTTKCQYNKGDMFKNKRDGVEPARCFQSKFEGKILPIGQNLDFISCEIIHDLIVDALQDEN